MDPNDAWHFTAQQGIERFSPNLRENPFKAPRDTLGRESEAPHAKVFEGAVSTPKRGGNHRQCG